MKHTGIKVTFQLEGATFSQHVTDGDTESYAYGAEVLDMLRNAIFNAAVAADVNDGTVTLTISK